MGYTVVGSVKTRALRIVWMLEELGQPFDLLPVRPASDEARGFNPSGKVPVLVVDGVALTDSVAIMTYLADKHGALTYAAGTLERARQDGFTLLILDEIEALLWTSSRHSFVLPEDKRMPEIKPVLRWEYERNVTRLAGRLEGPFLMGAQMTVPDLLLAHCLDWAGAAKFPQVAGLADYHARMTARPAYVRAQGR